MEFWTAEKDLLALLVSLIALASSIAATRQNLHATRKIAEDTAANERAMARDATFQRIHEMLIDPKAAAGRRRLFQAAAAGEFPRLGQPGWDEINYALALYDTLAGYLARGQVDRGVVLDAWHHPLVNIAAPLRDFLNHRHGESVRQPWAHLQSLLVAAEKYPCTCPTITGPGG